MAGVPAPTMAPNSALPVPANVGPTAAPAAPQSASLPAAPAFYDVTIVTTRKFSQARVMGVPPEEFGIERGARSIRDTNYCFHDVVNKTEAELIGEGYEAAQVRALPTYNNGLTNNETQSRNSVAEQSAGNSTTNTAGRLVKITEHYVRLDYEGRGRPCLYQVVTGDDKVMIRDGEPAITPFDAIPFAATTPVPVTHRFFGRSIADLVMPTQREKTAMKRGALDNLYLVNNPRVEVPEENAGPNTLDDLLVSRPGGVVRTRKGGGLQWQTVPDVTRSIFPMVQYLDGELEARTGLSKQSQGVDANALQNQSATAVAQVFSASQMRVKLIARVMAEGVRDIFSLLHGTIRKHGQQQQTVRLRKEWVDVNPRDWRTRDDMTINVGLGTGGKAQQFAQTMALGNVQKEIAAAGKTNIVGDKQLYNTAAELTRIMGHKNPDQFFKDPEEVDPQTGQLANPPPQTPPDPKVQAIQAKAQVDQQSAQLDAVHQQVKLQAEAQLAQLKAELDAKLKIMDAHIKAIESERRAHHDHRRNETQLAGDVLDVVASAHAHDTHMARTQADRDAAQHQQQNAE